MTVLLSSGTVPTRAGRLNPVAKLGAALIIAATLVLSVDDITAGVLLVSELIALPALGIGPRRLVRYAWPVALSLGGIWLANLLASGGRIGSLPVISMRLVALALPGVLLVLSTDPVDLADALVQRWHVPARLAYGALAALRLMPLMVEDLQSLRRARRARGVDAGRTPLSVLRWAGGIVFGLLVVALRRGVRLAAAMDSRGFGSPEPRTFARISVLRRSDRVLLAAVTALCAAAVGLSVAVGHWHFVFT